MAIGVGQYIDKVQAARLVNTKIHQCCDIGISDGFGGAYFPANKVLTQAVAAHYWGTAVVDGVGLVGLPIGVKLPSVALCCQIVNRSSD